MLINCLWICDPEQSSKSPDRVGFSLLERIRRYKRTLVESTSSDQKGGINVYNGELDPSFVNCQLKTNPNQANISLLTACSLSLLFSL